MNPESKEWGVCVVCERENKDYNEMSKPIVKISTMSVEMNTNFCCSECIEMLKIALDNQMIKMEVRRK
jgi:hypothetical protein